MNAAFNYDPNENVDHRCQNVQYNGVSHVVDVPDKFYSIEKLKCVTMGFDCQQNVVLLIRAMF